jgi:UDP-N-acetylmuramate dehydrogenase
VHLQENVALAPLTTFRVGGPARFLVRAENADQVREAVDFSRQRALPLFVMGGGSNLVVAESGFPGLVLQIAIGGISQKTLSTHELFAVGAGVEWDAFVAHAVELNCGGVECLSGIPGTVGGTPIQNVGAYGQEVSETIQNVQVLEPASGELRVLAAAECGFAYRTSMFNTSARGHYIVLGVTFKLRRGARPHLEYADLKKFFQGWGGKPSLAEVRVAVRQIRNSKAMLLVEGDPDCRSAGSFFKNPIISPAEYRELCSRPAVRGQNLPQFHTSDGRVKISAAWLVEHAGFSRGFARGEVGISSKHTLAIINRGGARAHEIVALKDEIQTRVAGEFGIHLEPEPVFVGF